MRKILAAILFCFLGFHSIAQKTDGWQIIQQKCTPCHNGKGIAPYNFNYIDDVKNNSNTLLYVIKKDIMPLWFAKRGARHFYNERLLTLNEKDVLVKWLDTLTVKSLSDVKQLYKPLNTKKNNNIKPDKKAFNLTTYRFTELSDQVFVNYKKLEPPINGFLKGATITYSEDKVVHHGVVYGVDSVNNIKNQIDSITGFVNGNAFGDITLGVYAPGVNYALLPDGFGFRIGSVKGLLYETHLLRKAEDINLTARVVFYLCKEPVVRNVETINLANLDDADPILPNTIKTYNGSHILEDTVSVLALMPHMHKLAVSFNSYAVTPNNDTIPLLELPKWSFEWQTIYRLDTLLVLPKNTVIHYKATFDNTTNNLENPSSPPEQVLVNQGWSTKNEMLIFGIQYTDYLPKDEKFKLKWVSIDD
jgi:hypothetical protein